MTNANGNGTGTTTALAESHHILRERTFHRDDDVNYLLGLFRNQAVTGTLMIDLSQGAVNSIRLAERQKIKPE